MGYSYDQDGKLCCDDCGKSGGVRKYRCPFGWCPAPAFCPECRRKNRQYLTKRYHRQSGCEERHNEFQRREAQKRAMLEQGKFLRTSALGHDGKVKVLFRNINGEERAYFMSHKTYRAIPLLVNAAIEDYKGMGRVTKAKSLQLYEPI